MKALVLGTKEYPLGTNKDDPSPSGGMELYVEHLVRNLSDIDLTIVTRKFSGSKSHEKKNGIEIIRVSWLNGFFFRNPTFNLNSFRKGISLDYDVIISHGEVANFFSLFLSKLKRKPVIMVNHGLASEQEQYNSILKAGFRLIDKITYSHADAVVTHSPSKLPDNVKYNFIKPGLDTSKLKIDTSLKKKYKLKGNVIVFTGRLMKTKGVEYLIKGLSKLNTPYTCFVVGDGPERKRLEQLSSNLKTNVIFTGFRKEINKFLSIADVFVSPSLSESLNYSMLEAAYMKVPIISTDLGIMPKNSFIKIKDKDPKSITAAIENLRKRSDMIKNAYQFTLQFNWKNAAKEYTKLIKRILEERK